MNTFSFFSTELQASVGGVVPGIEKARLYRGKGGEMMRGAVCHVIERTAHVGLPLPVKTLKLLEGSILDNLQHPTPDIQVSKRVLLVSSLRRPL